MDQREVTAAGLVNEKNADKAEYLIRFASVAQLVGTAKRLGMFHGDVGGYGRASGFYGGLSPEEVCHKAAAGDPDIADQARRLLERIEDATIEAPGREWIASPAGAYPVVAEALSGSPTPMREYRSVASEHATLGIYVGLTSSQGYDYDALLKRGVAILALVEKLQARRPVELNVICTLPGKGFHSGNFFIVTQLDTRPLDLSMAGFVLGHCGFDRQIHLGLCCKLGNDVRPGSIGWSSIEPKDTAGIRAYLGLAPQDIYIPAAHLDDSMIRRPVKWVNAKLREALNVAQEGE